MDRLRVSGVVGFLSFKEGGTKCDASVGRSVGRLFWLWLCPLALGHWGTGALVGLAWPAGWLVAQAGLVRQGLESEGLQLQASATATATECGVWA